MRIFSTKFAAIALALAALVAIAEVGPRALSDNELSLSDHGPAPDFTGISNWLNSSPLTAASLQGKVVLIQFWTFSCINSMEFDRLDVDKSGALDPKELKLSKVQVRYPRSADLGK